MLRFVRAQGTVKLGLHAALVLQMPGQAGVIVVNLAAVLTRVSFPQAIQVAHRARIWKTEKYGSDRLERTNTFVNTAATLPREIVHSVRIEQGGLIPRPCLGSSWIRSFKSRHLDCLRERCTSRYVKRKGHSFCTSSHKHTSLEMHFMPSYIGNIARSLFVSYNYN